MREVVKRRVEQRLAIRSHPVSVVHRCVLHNSISYASAFSITLQGREMRQTQHCKRRSAFFNFLSFCETVGEWEQRGGAVWMKALLLPSPAL